MRQKMTTNSSQLETYIRQEWDQIPTPETHNLDIQMSLNLIWK